MAAPTPAPDRAPDGPLALRVLTGPNLYFTRPAVAVTLDATGVLRADAAEVLAWQQPLRVRRVGVGLPDSPARHRAAADLAAALVRRAAAGLTGRLAAVARIGDDETVVVAFPFRHRHLAETFGTAVGRAWTAITRDGVPAAAAVADATAAVRGAEPGESVRARRPEIPVVAVTGTNGKTTTTRLIAHLIKAGGRTPGWSSTDGIVIDGEVVETGDWSGPGGAARVLDDPRVQVAVTETARGGILLRGVGTAVNDVSVVTNISADHLGLLGVHTLEQLAEVKSVVVRITRPGGWAVLNADDLLVRAMQAVTRARPWFFSPDPDCPHLDEALDAGGRAITVVDGTIVVLARGLDPVPVAPVLEVPITLSGTSRVNVANALAATAAALAVGVDLADVRAGLRSFVADADHNAGRLNVYGLGGPDGTVVILDLAHNEASLTSLLDVAESFRLPDGVLGVVLGTAGDRTDDAIHAMGELAARRTPTLVIAGQDRYRRGREPGEMEAVWRAGAAEVGVVDVPVVDDEAHGLRHLLEAHLPPGSVVAVCALEQRAEMAAEIARRGGAALTPDQVGRRVGLARR